MRVTDYYHKISDGTLENAQEKYNNFIHFTIHRKNEREGDQKFNLCLSCVILNVLLFETCIAYISE